MTWSLILLPLLILASGVFSGGETALFSLSPYQRQQFETSTHRRRRAVMHLINRPQQLLATLLLGNMTVNVLFFAIASVAVLDVSQRIGGLVGTLVALLPLLAIILFGEVVPKAIAFAHAPSVAALVATPLLLLNQLFGPLRRVLNILFITPAVRLLSPESIDDDHEISHRELQLLLSASSQRGALDVPTSALLHEIVELHDILVREVMTPRADMVVCHKDDTRESVIDLVHKYQVRQVPVHAGDIDNIEGLVSVRDLFLYPGRSLIQLARPALFVPEQASIDNLLKTLRERGERTAIVVDEYGGTAGLVTLRDVVEEIVGDLYEPAETPVELVQEESEDTYRVSGSLSIRDWGELFGLPPGLGGVDTVAGLVVAEIGHIPTVGQSIRVRNLELIVDEMEGRRVTWLRLKRLHDDDDGADNGESREKAPADTEGRAK